MRIAVAGFQHETNTFAPGVAGVAQFRMADSWPALLQGADVITRTRGMNLPIAGAAAAAAGDIELVPILWCAAEPSGPVTDEAFDLIAGMIRDGIRQAGPLDGVCLDLHGAMVTERHEDGEGALLRQIRGDVGDLPIAVSLDLHANVTPAMVEAATVMTIYRTYPHLDMAATGARAMRRLVEAIRGRRFAPAFRQIPFLVPLHAQYTGAAPCRDLYSGLAERDGNLEFAEIAMGFTAADIHDCGPSVLAYADTPARAEELAGELAEDFVAARARFDVTLYRPEEAISMARGLSSPVVLADVQDNPGAGGTSDTTGVLRALVDAGVDGAIVGVLCDPEFARMAHEAGEGAVLKAALGSKSGLSGHLPLEETFTVDRLSDGEIAYTGEMYGGGVATLGPSCAVSIRARDARIRVVVSSIRVQCLDRALFTHFGIDPAVAAIICVKSTTHHRADFEGLASRVLNVAAPGAFSCTPAELDYRRLRPGVGFL